MSRKPKLLVFDLDYTLWPFHIGTMNNELPFKQDDEGTLTNYGGHRVEAYPEVSEVLKQLKNEGYLLGVASRTHAITAANQLIKSLGWEEYLTYMEIFPGCKVTHFNNIKQTSNVDFKDMIFFDDERRNIRDLTKHGVFSVLVTHGVNKAVVEHSLQQYSKNLK